MWWLDTDTTSDAPNGVDVLLGPTDEVPKSRELTSTPKEPLALAAPPAGKARTTLYRSARAKIAIPYLPCRNTNQETSEQLANSVLESTKAEHARHLADVQRTTEAKLKEAEQRFATDMRRLRLTIANLEDWQQQRDADFQQKIRKTRATGLEAAKRVERVLAQRDADLVELKAALSAERRKSIERQAATRELADSVAKYRALLESQILLAPHDQHIAAYELARLKQQLSDTQLQMQAAAEAEQRQLAAQRADFVQRLEQADDEQQETVRVLLLILARREEELASAQTALESEQCQRGQLESQLSEKRATEKSLLQTQRPWIEAEHNQHVVEFQLAHAKQRLVQTANQSQAELAAINAQQIQREASLERQLEQALTEQRSLASQLATVAAQRDQDRIQNTQLLAVERKKAAENDSAMRALRRQIEQQQALLNRQIYQAAHDQHVVEFKLAQANHQLQQEISQLQTVIASGDQRAQQLQDRENELLQHLERTRSQQRSLIAQHESKRAELEGVLATERKRAADGEVAIREQRSRIDQQQSLLNRQIYHAAHDQHIIEFKLAQANARLHRECSQLQTVIASGNQRVQQLQQREAELVRHLEQAQAQHRSVVAQLESKLTELEGVITADRERALERDAALREMQCKLVQQQKLLDSQILQAAHEQHILEFQLAKSNHELVQNGTQLETTIASNDQHVQQLQFRKEELSRQLEQSVAAQQNAAIQLANVVAQRDAKLSQLNAALASEREQRTECESQLRQIASELAEQRAIIQCQVLRVPHDQHVVEFRLAQAERQLVENNEQLQTAIASSSHQTQRFQQREAVLSRQLEQALAEQKQAAHQRELTVAQRDERLAELNAVLATERGRLEEYQTSISQLEDRVARQQGNSLAQIPAGEHDQHVWEFKVAKAEKHRVETLIASRKSIQVLESQIELRESEVLKRLAESWSARRRTEIELAEAVSKHDQTVTALNARLITLQRLADDRAATIRELEDSLLQLKKSRILDFQQAQDAAQRRESESRHSAWIQELEASVESLKKRLSESLAAETTQRDSLAREQAARTEAETKVQECFNAIERLQRQVTDLQTRLQREAGGRRKAEGALKRAAELADENTIAQTTQLQIASEQRIERLTNELEATKYHLMGLRRQAQARLQNGKLKNQVA